MEAAIAAADEAVGGVVHRETADKLAEALAWFAPPPDTPEDAPGLTPAYRRALQVLAAYRRATGDGAADEAIGGVTPQQTANALAEAAQHALDFIEYEHPQMPPDLNTARGQLRRALAIYGDATRDATR